jgi:hypothetical protein
VRLPWIRGECGDIPFPWNPWTEIFVWVNQECCNVIRHLIVTLAKEPKPLHLILIIEQVMMNYVLKGLELKIG